MIYLIMTVLGNLYSQRMKAFLNSTTLKDNSSPELCLYIDNIILLV